MLCSYTPFARFPAMLAYWRASLLPCRALSITILYRGCSRCLLTARDAVRALLLVYLYAGSMTKREDSYVRDKRGAHIGARGFVPCGAG